MLLSKTNRANNRCTAQKKGSGGPQKYGSFSFYFDCDSRIHSTYLSPSMYSCVGCECMNVFTFVCVCVSKNVM